MEIIFKILLITQDNKALTRARGVKNDRHKGVMEARNDKQQQQHDGVGCDV